jgi:acyl-CoA thioesterase
VTSKRAETLARFWAERIPFNRHCGFSVTRWDDDGVCMEVDETDELSNGAGSMHGGVIATLVDTVANAAAINLDDFAPGSTVATVSMTVNYVRPARGHLVAATECARSSGSLQSVSVDVHDASERLVARGLVTVKVSVAATPDPT